MKNLKRTKIDLFKIEKSITIESIKNKTINLESKIISIEDVFRKNEKIYLNEKKLKLFLNGVKLTYNMQDGLYRIYSDNQFIGLGIVENNFLKRDIVINAKT